MAKRNKKLTIEFEGQEIFTLLKALKYGAIPQMEKDLKNKKPKHFTSREKSIVWYLIDFIKQCQDEEPFIKVIK